MEKIYNNLFHETKPTTINSLNQYLSEISHPLLTKEQEQELFKRISEGDEEAQKEIIEKNLRLVIVIAKRYQGLGLDFLDLIQEGNLGLIRAVSKFDYQKGYRFSTYAKWWIVQTILRALANKSNNIRIPVYLENEIIPLKKYIYKFYTENGYFPTKDEIQIEFGFAEEKIDKILYVIDMNSTSLNASIASSNEKELINFVLDEESVELGYENIKKEQFLNIIENEANLTKKQKEILYLRFGFYDGKPKTLQQIADIYGMSKEGIRKTESKILYILKNNANMNEMYDGIVRRHHIYKIKKKNMEI